MPAAAPMVRDDELALEEVQPGDRYADYVLAPYEPPAPPHGKLRSVNLLYASFAHEGVEREGRVIVDALRTALGQGRTVWGIKHHRGALWWELYFYNPGRVFDATTLENVQATLRGNVAIDAHLGPHVRWHMFSFELRPEALARVDSVRAYVRGEGGSDASRSYGVHGTEARLENLYTFHDPMREPDDLIARVKSSLHLPSGGPSSRALWPELFRCRRICVANKPASDGMYFSGVDLAQLRFALAKLGWPEPIRARLDALASRLDHVLWDVGFDFTAGGIEKSAFYATF